MPIADKAAIEQFLSVTPNINPVINRIINTIKNQEEKYHFLNKVINREGINNIFITFLI